MEQILKQMIKNHRKEKHEQIYNKPMCHLCDDCYKDRSKKHNGCTYYCRITGNDVGASHFGMVSPRNCPKRKEIINAK